MSIKLGLGWAATALLLATGGCSTFQRFQTVPTAAQSAAGTFPLAELGKAASDSDLMYVSNWSSGYVSVLTYPQGVPVGSIGGFDKPEGECVDSTGNVLIADRLHHEVQKFAHGKMTPIKRFVYAGAQPFGCSVDPGTGNVAVTNGDWSKKQTSDIAIFPHAGGTPQTYAWKGAYALFCGYDDRGNLYVDGVTKGHHYFTFAELPLHGSAIVPVSLNETIQFPGSVQWDGKYLMVADSEQSVAYRFTFTQSGGTAVGSPTYITGAYDEQQLWVYGGKVTGTDGDVYLWNYPSGGSIVKAYTGFSNPVAAVISPARK